ncbi:MAG: LysR substrate-binding domain-containing protein [Mangrovicoccus sp.]
MDLIDGLRAFVATAETGSFTAAAERLGMSNRLSSKYVAELESRLGVRLLQRTTRKVGLTPAGEQLLARAPAMLDEFDAVLASVREETQGYSGVIRISAPVTFGEIYVKDMLARFAEPHPDLIIDLRLTDAFVDLASEGIDLAFRIGDTGMAALKRRKLGNLQSVLVASPEYLAKTPPPAHPKQLVDHNCILDTNRDQPHRWVFHQGDQVCDITLPARFRVNSARAARDLALAGHGVAYCPRFVLENYVAKGDLRILCQDWQSPPHLLSAIYLEGRRLPAKIRALIDFAHQDWHGARLD